MTKEELEKKYETLSNSELMDIIQDKFSYTEMAILVAMSEVSKRNLNEDDIKQYKVEKEKEIRDFVIKNIADDLSFSKNFFFYIWIPFFNFPLKRTFMDGGFELKLKQANYYSWFGFIFLVLITGFGSNYEISTLTTLIVWMLTFVIAFLFDEFLTAKAKFENYNEFSELSQKTIHIQKTVNLKPKTLNH